MITERGYRVVAALICVALLLALAGCQAAPQTVVLAAPPAATPVAVAQAATPTPAATAQAASPAAAASTGDFTTVVRRVAAKVRPAVVQITNEQTSLDQFNMPFGVPAGVGSGFIYDAKGYILTNDHVVEGATKLLVGLPDGRSYEAKLIGSDPGTDLAVVQIVDGSLPIAEIGNPHDLQIGDWVVAIGNALALEGGPTVSAGVIGALGRTVQEPGTSGSTGTFLFDVIQTDAPINPGNSGGPLVDLNGRVVGINTLVAGSTGNGTQAEGIGFAIAIDTAKPIADQLVATGVITHPSLGFSYVPLNPYINVQLGVPAATTGVVVSRIGSTSAAAQSGLQRLDVITAVNGTALVNDSDLAAIVNTHKPNDVLTLSVLRNGQPTTVKLTLGTS